jgi:hypothetical protein
MLYQPPADMDMGPVGCSADQNCQPGVVATAAAVSAGVSSSKARTASRQAAARTFMESAAGAGADGYEVRTGER